MYLLCSGIIYLSTPVTGLVGAVKRKKCIVTSWRPYSNSVIWLFLDSTELFRNLPILVYHPRSEQIGNIFAESSVISPLLFLICIYDMTKASSFHTTLFADDINLHVSKSYCTCVWGDIETEIHLFFYCKFHDAARAILSNRVCNVVIDNKSSELFDCLNNVELLLIFLFRLPDDEPSHISDAVFCAVDDFLKSCNKFWQHLRDLVHHSWEIRAFLLYVLLMPIICKYIYMMCLVRRPPFQILLYSILLMRSWSAVLDASNTVYSFLHFRLVFSFSCAVFWKLDVTRQDCTSQVTAWRKIVVN